MQNILNNSTTTTKLLNNPKFLREYFASLSSKPLIHNHVLNKIFPEISAKIFPQELIQNLLPFYGFRTTQDLGNFLKTPLGKIITSEIKYKIATINHAREHSQHSIAIPKTSLKPLAFLTLGLLYQAEEFNLKFLKELEADLAKKNAKNKISTKNAEQAANYIEYLNKISTAYELSIISLTKQLNYDYKTANSVINQINVCYKQRQEAKLRYEGLNKAQDRVEQYLEQNINKDINSTQQIIFLKAKARELQLKLENKLEKINVLLAANQEEKAKKLLNKHNDLNVELQNLNDIIETMETEKKFYNKEGQLTHNVTEAAFILTAEQKIIKHNETYYLLDKHVNFALLNEQQKILAQQKYQKEFANISSIKIILVHNQGTEIAMYNEKQQQLSTKKQYLQDKIYLLDSQINKIKSAQQEVAILKEKMTIHHLQLIPECKPNNPLPLTPIRTYGAPNNDKKSNKWDHMHASHQLFLNLPENYPILQPQTSNKEKLKNQNASQTVQHSNKQNLHSTTAYTRLER